MNWTLSPLGLWWLPTKVGFHVGQLVNSKGVYIILGLQFEWFTERRYRLIFTVFGTSFVFVNYEIPKTNAGGETTT